MKISPALAGGLAGTLAVALLHEGLKQVTPDAPKMEKLDMEALTKFLHGIEAEVPAEDDLLKITQAGELVTHTIYYSLVGRGSKKGFWLRGVLSGLVAGITAVVLPKPLGLDPDPATRTPKTAALTLGIYILGGIAASAGSIAAAE